jgi:uncharacterized lipoprotein YajG
MYSVSRTTIKDLLLQASTMLLAGCVTCNHTPSIETPPTPAMRSPARTSIVWRTLSLTLPGLCGMQVLVAVARGADTSV